MANQAEGKLIAEGATYLGIEMGSTRIKAVLTDGSGNVLASGGCDWENKFENGFWTYSLDGIWEGLRECYRQLAQDVTDRYGVKLETLGAIGVSGMMHGYMPFDKYDKLLVPFRTWRNTTTAEAAEKLTNLFAFNVPQRWSVAHLYQAILNGEPHVGEIEYLMTIASYIHYRLTGERVAGIGEASGMFPIDSDTRRYDAVMLRKFDKLVAGSELKRPLASLLPNVLPAGSYAGSLTAQGAMLLDPTGTLRPGMLLCPPEGDAGTGMVATNSIAARTGNVSAGTSIFLMAVLEKPLRGLHMEVDIVTTPTGRPVAMVHCNTCTSEIDAWIKLFGEVISAAGVKLSKSELYSLMYHLAMDSDPDCGGLLAYNYHAGEPITGFEAGVPLFVRRPDAMFNLKNFIHAQLNSVVATLRFGMDILKAEGVVLDNLMGHGGFFKVASVGQRIMSAALEIPVSVMSTAGEGGPWGMALLAAYRKNKAKGESLDEYLDKEIFCSSPSQTIMAERDAIDGFEVFLDKYKKGLPILRKAVDTLT
ncbi:MAG: ATPase [Oscillospiraceae bacterium]|jgi:sugar (pentulose or hexulose) kinase|nr:ATPase [Oscillospiraceae bacterium]